MRLDNKHDNQKRKKNYTFQMFNNTSHFTKKETQLKRQ
jgi:hypothetical protein